MKTKQPPSPKAQNVLQSMFLFPTGSHSQRGIRVSTYDPEEAPPPGCQIQRKNIGGPRSVATISHGYNEKTMLLSSDDEYQ